MNVSAVPASTGIPNEGITWYQATTKNLGVDLGYKHNLIGLSLDFFQRDREGLLSTRASSVPAIFGASFGQENLNSDMTRGFEMTLSHMNKIGEFTYSVNANVSFTRSRYDYIERSPSTDQYNNWLTNNTDRWQGLYWGYNVIGQFQSVEEAWAYPTYTGLPSGFSRNLNQLPGDLKVEDWNEDGVIDSNDLHPIKSYVNQQGSASQSAPCLLWRQY